ncbi:MAG: hypothetical protein Nk1A_8100 [Endomicrobiia bacterium]|nr:MAG: hypothetical protein Nk1A_8100 [Endomicrobiia bacterium]
MTLQVTNSVGQDCISISATGSKVIGTIIQHFNELAKEINDYSGDVNLNSAVEALKIPSVEYLVKTVNGLKEDGSSEIAELKLTSKPAFSNINWENVPKLKQTELYNAMLVFGALEDILEKCSILISASTDNAKELILSKIGATRDLMSIYMYGLLIGEDFSTIATFMTRPEIAMVQQKAAPSLLDSTKKDFGLSGAIAYYTKGVSPERFNLARYLGGIDNLFKSNFEETNDALKK